MAQFEPGQKVRDMSGRTGVVVPMGGAGGDGTETAVMLDKEGIVSNIKTAGLSLNPDAMDEDKEEAEVEVASEALMSMREVPVSEEDLAAYALLRLKLESDVPSIMKTLNELPKHKFEEVNALKLLADAADPNELIKLNNLASDELEREGGVLDRVFEVEESGNKLDILASVASTAEAMSTISAAAEKLGKLSEEDEEPEEPEEPRAKRSRKLTAAAIQTLAAEAEAKAAAAARKAQLESRAAAAAAAKAASAEAATKIPKTGELVPFTPSVNRSSHLASISSTDGQIRGNYGPEYLRNVYANDAVQKQCWICGLPIFAKSPDNKNTNEYEHVQAFKTALFESLLYVPDNVLGHIGGNYRIARQCIGEYSHNNCNGGGSVVSKTGGSGGRTGKGDLSLKTGGRKGSWDDLYPSSDAIKELLVGSDGSGSDPKCIWAQFEPYQRKEFGTADRLFRARKDILYARVAQVCYMVRRCVDWKQHALAKGIALKSVLSGEEVKQKLLTLFKHSSALKSYPSDDVKMQNKMYMQPYSPSNNSALFGTSLTIFKTRKTLEEFVKATIDDFNASYGAAITGIRVDTEENIKKILDSGVLAAPPPPVEASTLRVGEKRGRGRTLRRECSSCGHRQEKAKRWKTQRKPRRRDGEHQVEVEIVAL
jgi:hypothetical protein